MQPMVFDGTQIDLITRDGEAWVTASNLGQALGYKDSKAVQRIITRNQDEFSDTMSGVVNLTTPFGEQAVRVFSLRGAHLVAMFARTDKAKAFRRWILDVLDALHRGGEYVRKQYEAASKAFEDRREQASEEGRGLSSWRWEKQPLQTRVEYWRERQQLCLQID